MECYYLNVKIAILFVCLENENGLQLYSILLSLFSVVISTATAAAATMTFLLTIWL